MAVATDRLFMAELLIHERFLREISAGLSDNLVGRHLSCMDGKLGKSSEELEHLLIEKAKLWLNAGTMYGAEGEGFMRWNIACPRSSLIKGVELFRDFVGCAC